MEFATVRDFRINATKVFKRLEEQEEIVVTKAGRPIALMVPVEGPDLDAVRNAFKRARAEIALEKIQANARDRGLDRISDAEIDALIRQVRKERRER